MDIRRNRVTGICLRKLRKRAGLTQTQVALRLNRHQSFVSKVENAERELSLTECYSYAEAIDTTYSLVMDEVYKSLDEEGLLPQLNMPE